MRFLLYIFLIFLCPVSYAKTDLSIQQKKEIDIAIKKSMIKEKVPVVSIAVVNSGKIVYAKAYAQDPQFKVNFHTIFQAASIGKSVTALGVLLLVEQHQLKLDEDVNSYLKTWKIPNSVYTEKNKVNLKQILSMTSGLSVSGFLGQSNQDPIPTLQQILNGQPPAENKPVEVMFIPGSRYEYSGGGYEVLEQFIEDVSSKSFSSWMQKNILIPLAMKDSYYLKKLPPNLQIQAVSGFLKEGDMIPGNWKWIPALGAGGLWSTPTDIAKFSIAMMRAYENKHPAILSQKFAREMLTRQPNTDFGLGVLVDKGCGKNLNFRKEGHNLGFYNLLIMFPKTKQGLVIMTNSENGFSLIQSVVPMIAKKLNWPSYQPIQDESIPMQAHSNC